MPALTTKPLDAGTWAPFADLVERHNGVFGGCWCLSFHAVGKLGLDFAGRRDAKAALVREGRAHAALVFAGEETCVGWCQFGSPAELPGIKNRKLYDADATMPPDWRITCFFVDRHHRRQRIAATALTAALDQILALGGGTVEAYPEDTAGRLVSPTFLHAGTLAMYESFGFARTRKIGKNKWVVRRVVGTPAG